MPNQTNHRDHRTTATLLRAGVGLAGCLLWLSANGCDFPGRPTQADRPVLPRDVLEFSALFKQNCSGCHGADGTLGAAPPLSDSLFRAIVPKESLEKAIAKGRPGTPMPAFAIENGGTLTPAQIQVLVLEIKGLRYKTVAATEPGKSRLSVVEDAQGIAPQWGQTESPPANVPPYLGADRPLHLSEAEQERVRKTTFATACAGCHNDRGEGGEGMAGAINQRAFLQLASDQMLRRIIITGRADLKMPDFADTHGRLKEFQPLSSQQVSELTALLSAWRKPADNPKPDATASFPNSP